jgi:predicted membrane protein
MRNSNESILFEEKSEEISSDILSIIAIVMVGLLFAGFVVHVVYRYISCTKKLKIKISSEKVKKKKEKHPLRVKKPNFEKISIGEDLPLKAPEVKTTWNCARHS